jgi:hypothetical protein
MYNAWVLNLLVHHETSRIYKVNTQNNWKLKKKETRQKLKKNKRCLLWETSFIEGEGGGTENLQL